MTHFSIQKNCGNFNIDNKTIKIIAFFMIFFNIREEYFLVYTTTAYTLRNLSYQLQVLLPQLNNIDRKFFKPYCKLKSYHMLVDPFVLIQ